MHRPRGGDEGGQQPEPVRAVGSGHLAAEIGGKEAGGVRSTHPPGQQRGQEGRERPELRTALG
eukprot:CAMPEP_0113728988 /NCGR_PEP_ID=MMETSP0038_2-20120614/42260_1 /TAXON_ID=2898 /ORGANISM="Cryptomonas paramecium" /LENGTH=62 /DNA_ID=CAMNT_0000660701 /DNA_START=271 /DNA_END=456 /DNA_ORIENTATION=- /assembly_acc=CAM_ASM_000170